MASSCHERREVGYAAFVGTEVDGSLAFPSEAEMIARIWALRHHDLDGEGVACHDTDPKNHDNWKYTRERKSMQPRGHRRNSRNGRTQASILDSDWCTETEPKPRNMATACSLSEVPHPQVG